MQTGWDYRAKTVPCRGCRGTEATVLINPGIDSKIGNNCMWQVQWYPSTFAPSMYPRRRTLCPILASPSTWTNTRILSNQPALIGVVLTRRPFCDFWAVETTLSQTMISPDREKSRLGTSKGRCSGRDSRPGFIPWFPQYIHNENVMVSTGT